MSFVKPSEEKKRKPDPDIDVREGEVFGTPSPAGEKNAGGISQARCLGKGSLSIQRGGLTLGCPFQTKGGASSEKEVDLGIAFPYL